MVAFRSYDLGLYSSRIYKANIMDINKAIEAISKHKWNQKNNIETWQKWNSIWWASESCNEHNGKNTTKKMGKLFLSELNELDCCLLLSFLHCVRFFEWLVSLKDILFRYQFLSLSLSLWIFLFPVLSVPFTLFPLHPILISLLYFF